MLPDPFDDTVAQSWLDAGEDSDFLTNSIIRSASDAFGHAVVDSFGQKLEAEGANWRAAKRYYSGELSSHSSSASACVYHSYLSAAILTRLAAGELSSRELSDASLPVAELLQQVEHQTPEIRTVEFVIRVRASTGFKVSNTMHACPCGC